MPKITKAGGPSDANDPNEGRVQTGEGSFAEPEQSETLDDVQPVEESDDDRRAEYEALTVEELREGLRQRELSPTGTKAELVDRLVEDDEAWKEEERP